MLERIYRYRVTCRCAGYAKPESECPVTVEYETATKKSLPPGWAKDVRHYGDEKFVYHYSPQCWAREQA